MRKPRRYRPRRSYSSRHRKRINVIPLLIIIFILGFFFWAVFQFFSTLFSGIQTESITTDLNILKGRTEFQLSQSNNQWTPAFSHQNFVEGDSLKTSKKSKSELKFMQNNTITLDEKTKIIIHKLEKNAKEETDIKFEITSGQIWFTYQPKEIHKNNLNIKTSKVNISTSKSAIFDIQISEEAQTIYLIKGNLSIIFKDSEKSLNMGTGQKLIIYPQTTFLTENDLESIDIDFINSDWHIYNLEKTNPEQAQKLLDKKNKVLESQNTEENTETEEGLSDIESPTILQPEQNLVIPANQKNPVLLSGTAPLDAYQIEVNGFALSRFKPGDRKWTYYLASKFNTLKPGKNTYKVVTVDRLGKKSKPAIINVTYNGTAQNFNIPKKETLSAEKNKVKFKTNNTKPVPVSSSNFGTPIVTSPQFFKDNPHSIFQTASSVVTFYGDVPANTQYVEINGFKLRLFHSGDKTFKYIANARPGGNMKEGQNTYTIIAYGPNGVSSQTKIVIEYTPVKL